MTPKLLVICGPTATGKTKLALKLARKFNGELISADSRQIYKGMDIGTGKDLPSQRVIDNDKLLVRFRKKEYTLRPYQIKGIGLWMYDIIYPDEKFSVAHFQYLVTRVINHVRSKGKLPIIVGGTGLYIKSILEPMTALLIPQIPKLRRQLASATTTQLQKKLSLVSPDLWKELNKSDRQNPRRLIRKIEIGYWLTKKKKIPFSNTKQYDSLVICLNMTQRKLYHQIDMRVASRVTKGIIKEVKHLIDRFSWDLPSMSGLGYRQWRSYFETNLKEQTASKARVLEQWTNEEHHYAKRQLTWFKKQSNTHWIDVGKISSQSKITDLIRSWYTKT